MRKSVLALSITIFTIAAHAKTQIRAKEFCGKRTGTAGNAVLVNKNNQDVIILATQGGEQKLLEEADELIGKNSGIKRETGTQNGQHYCVTAEIDETGEPVRIVKASLAPKKK